MKKSISIFLIIILIMQLLVFITPTKIYASDAAREETDETQDTSIGGMMSSAEKFLEAGKDDAINHENLAKVNKTIYNLFLAVAIVIAVIVGAYLGIKIMVGTIEEKAKIKEMLIPYIVGVVVIFAVFPIWNFVVQTGTDTVGAGAYTGTGESDTGKKYHVVTTEEDIKMRVEPKEDSDFIGGPIRKGTILDYVDETEEWFKVKYGSTEGWISKNDAERREW